MKNNNKITIRLYAILFNKTEHYIDGVYKNTKINDDSQSFGIVCPYFVGNYPEFKLKETVCVKEKSYNVDYVEFKYIGPIEVDLSYFTQLLNFHFTLVNDMYERKVYVIY